MNRHSIIYTVFAAAAALVVSCSYLDRDTGDTMSEEEMFSRIETAEGYLNNAYIFIPDFLCSTEDSLSRYNIGGATDELGYQLISYGARSPYGINTGSWSPSEMPIQQNWSDYYQGIRRCNNVIAHADDIPEEISASGINRKERLLGEAYALRGYFYFLLFRQWGGVPLVTTVLDPGDLSSFENIRRAEPQEIVESAVADLTTACTLLPVQHEDINYGRFTKVAAKAVISEIKLYWASPLWNPDGEKQRWKDAANAASDALNTALDNGYVLAPRYSDLFSSVICNEYLLVKSSMMSECFYWDYYHFPAGYGATNTVEGVLQEMVDAFEMDSTGELPVLGYNDDGTQIVNSAATDYDPLKPWTGRDPRFYYDVMCHGDALQGGFIDTSEGSAARITQNPTYYYVRKYTDVNHNLLKNYSEFAFIYRRFAVIRTAELYLNLAEALCETEGASARVREYVNIVRRRANCATEIPSGLSTEEMRERIRRERRVELCFEGHRFWDVRRWDIARTVDNGPVHRVEVEVQRDAAGEKVLEASGNTTITAISYPVYQNRVFKANLFPIPQEEIDRSSVLEQNPEWK